MIQGLIIAAIVIYAAGLSGYVAAWIAEAALKAESEKDIARKMKDGFLFVVCLPYWISKKIGKQMNRPS